MSYQPNTDYSTKRITLCSSGLYKGPKYNPVFTLERAITLDDRLLHVCGIEMITMAHPTYFSKEYMTGELTIYSGGETISSVITEDFFDDTLKCVYMSQFSLSRVYLDVVLFYLLSFLKRVCGDPGELEDGEPALVQFLFTGFFDEDYKYNRLGSTNLEDVAPANRMKLIDINAADNYRHTGCIESMIQATANRFKIKSTFSDDTRVTLKGNFLAMFGLDPTKTIELKDGVTIDARLPIFGHDYICVGSSLGSNTLSAAAGGKLNSTNLLAVVPTPRNPDDTEIYQHYGGKVETSSSIIDVIELQFTDVYGVEILSLEDFVVVLTIDQVKTEDLPQPDHISLHNVRKRLMEETRKKLRI